MPLSRFLQQSRKQARKKTRNFRLRFCFFRHGRISIWLILLFCFFIYFINGLFFISLARASEGIPKILNYQGRLFNSGGDLLGGATGADYCFKFSIYDDKIAGAPDNKIWPASLPSIMTVNVEEGVFNVGVGDIAAGGDALDYNFYDNDTIFLNVEVATMVGADCAGEDEIFENLNPRHQIYASGYAINSDMLDGLNASSGGGTSEYVPSTNEFGNLFLNGESQGSDVSSSLLYINSSSVALTDSLFGLAVNGNEKFKIDADGNVYASNTIYVGSQIYVGGHLVCLADGTNCPSMGGGGWHNDSGQVYLEISTDNVTVGSSTSPLGKFNIYGDADEVQFLVQGGADQTKNLSEWRDDESAITTWIAPSGDIGTSGTIYAKKFKHASSQGNENILEWEDSMGDITGWINTGGDIVSSGTAKVKGVEIYSESPAIKIYDTSSSLRAWIDGDGSIFSSGTVYTEGLQLNKQLKVAQNSPSNPVADAWNVYSTADTKDILREINPHGYLEQIIGGRTFEYKRKVDIKEEYKEALEEKIEEDWRAVLESGEEIIINRDIWNEIKEDELETNGWADEKRKELFEWKSALPKFSKSRLGVMADDITIPSEILAFGDDGEPIGIDISAYAGFLHVGLKEAGLRIIFLEDKISKGAYSSSTCGGNVIQGGADAALIVDNISSGDALRVQSASNTVFSINATGDALFGPSTDSAIAFQIKDAVDTEILFRIDTENNLVKIGDDDEAGNPTTLFVLDAKADAGDPYGVNGAMYYNGNTRRFRCFENDIWKDCIGAGKIRESYFTFFSIAQPMEF